MGVIGNLLVKLCYDLVFVFKDFGYWFGNRFERVKVEVDKWVTTMRVRGGDLD